MGIMYEKRPLKRPRLGPPDVYPQEPRQKEDELTSTNVKHGFSTTPQSSDEFGTARNFNYSSSKIGQFFSGILSKKEELNTLPDCGRKRQQVNPKDNFWPATARTKAQIEAWFKDLAGSKPLSQLAKKAPNFNKKEEIFITLTEYQVAMPRAAWFIKLSSAYTVAVSEAKIKKRQLPDPTTEWTTTLIKFLKDQIPKLAEHYQSAIPGNEKTPPSQSGQGTPSHSSSGNPPGSSTPNSTIPNSMHSPGNTSTLGSTTPGSESIDWRQALRLWNYCTRLAKYLLDEGLLDRHDFLTWIIELLDKRAPDDGLLRLFLPLALQHMCEFVCCEGLSRRLATTCAKKAAAICSVLSETTLRTLNQPAVFSKQADRTDTNGVPLSPAPNETPNGDVKLNISQIKRSATPADQNQGTLNANSLGTPNPNHSLGTPNPTHSLGTPNPTQPMEVQVKEENESPPRDNKPTITSVITASLNPVQVGFGEILNCAYHRDVIIQLATILQIICIECPTAMVWSGCGSHLQGSPLDLLPLPPSALPMPHMDSSLTEEHRRMVYESEQEIAARSKKAESKWCTDKWQTSSQARVLAVLEALDRHCFDRVDQNNNLDTLYKEVFANCTPPSKDAVDTKDQEWPCSYAVVKVLCEWAVCGARWGEHRAMAAAALLDKRQHQLLHQHHDHHATGSDDKESVSSGQGLYNGPPIFQNLLLRFLDNDAPVLVSFSDESPSPPPGNRQQFANLVHLFGELIRRDVFSHDAYMCTLISRGDLISPTEPASSGTANCHTVAPPANSSGTNHNMDDDIFAGIDLKPKMEENVRMDLDDSKIDDDLDKLLQHIKEDQQNSMDAPDSPKDPGEPSHSVNSPMMGPSGMSIPGMQSMGMGPMSVPGMRTTSAGPSSVCPTPASVSRHYHYTMHFPLPPAEPDHTPHDANQRHILLYGVGRQRDEAKHVVKKMTKEICKLFSKKFSIDVAEGGKIKKHSRSEFNFEAVTQKFQSMSMYEQGAVSWAVGGAVCEALAAFSSGATSYLPQPEHVAFALDLCEIALNVHGLIDTCIQILKELSEVEGALISRGAPSSGLAAPRAYTSALALYTVGALRRYHSCLLLCVEQTSAVFEQLCRLVKCVVNPGDCGSAERCVLAQLHDLYKAAAHLCHAPHADTFANAYPKIKQALYSPLTPTPSSYVYNPQFLSEFFTNPRKGKIEIAWARQVAESPVNRYSFVCSAMLAVCREVDNDRVNELGVLCAEMTAWCSSLAAEWLGALVALCGAQHYPAGAPPHTAPPPLYPDLLHHRDLHDAAAHDALAVFTCILVARHCFSLEDFVRHAALPSLLKACGGGGVSGNPANAPSPDTGARLTCHLLLRLFKTVDTPQPGLYSVSTSPGPGGTAAGVRLSCDRHLLAAAHKNIGVGPVLATLKAILMVGDSTARDGGKPGGKKSCELSHILGTSDTVPTDAQLELMSMVDSEMSGGHRTPRGSGGVGSTLLDSSQSLSSLARRVLAEICSEEWVLQKCLQNPDELYQPDMLLDSMLTPRQAQRLLHMICYPDSASHTQPDLDQKTMITRLLENLEQWSLRMSWLDLQLMFKQFPSGSAELSAWLDTVARAVINVFQQPAPPPPDKDRTGTDRGVVSTSKWSESVWLVAPLVAKLPAAVQGRVLKQAGQILETGWGSGCSGNCSSGSGGGGGSHRDCKSHQSPSYKGSTGAGSGGKRGVSGSSCGGGCGCGGGNNIRLANEPLLSLVLTCLRHQDDQKESLLSSIHAQLQHYLTHTRDHERSTCSDSWQDEVAPEALQLRFSLAGGMFDAIRRSYQLISDWAVLLTQLVAHQVVDAYNNSLCRSNLFTTLIDMLATLIHSTLADGGDDNNRKHYQNLMKKLKKEIGDRHGPSVQSVRQLLPLSKNTIIEVIACEPLGCLVDQKGNKITGFDSDKKQGLRLTDKQRVSSWELVEGGRNPAPLSWAWFAATKVERKPLTYENAHRLLKYHTHSLVKPLSYYLESLPLPPEDLETNESKQDNGSLDGSPTSAGKGRSRSSSCKKMKKSKPTTPTSGPPVPSTNGGPTGITPAPAQQPQFMQQQQQWFPPPGQNYYTPPAGVSPRSVAPPANTQSKQAITNMLRQRLPFNQMSQMQQSGGYPGAPHPRGPPFPRQGMRQMQPNQMGQMQPNQMNPMSAMSGMGPMGQMTSVQMGPGAMGPNQMGAQQMGAGQMGATQMSAGQMGGMGGQMFGGQYGGMQQGYGGYGQQMLQGGQQQMMNQGMGQQVNQMSQQVNPMGQGVNTIAQNVGQMNQGVGQTGQMPQGMGQMGQGMGQMGQGMGQMGQMVQGGAMGGMNSQGGGMGPQGGNAMGGFPGQQSFQQNMMGGRTSQEAAYMAQQRQNARPQYNMQAPNVTMGGMGGPAPPYPRGIQPQQSAQYQQMTQQQRMRQQQMLAMQQQQQGGLVQHLQRQQYQPPY
ncbi:mediator of RNA polymerase II transcription subunit 12-like isoform X2 [Hyposmocoma kahamanoa]|uniref:mediator of RNA polymerase II transcription subunit 12-like isoform X2 n=1 Tax=Hyposmocoma kahamanoa TaxID=1477025 RepID=UPI000E6D977C|nr:mediator of RNA polymerase II transcription subunit 12-like isoform X2 [Hyposmocoma kahamanoa]